MEADPSTSTTPDPAVPQAVVICTRNRPRDLRRTLASIAAQEVSFPLEVIVVDASDPATRDQTAAWLFDFEGARVRYLPYTALPSSARQRNAGLDALAPDAAVVHFLDDDVSLHPGYFERLAEILRSRPDVGGVAPRVISDGPEDAPSRRSRLWRYLFLIDHPVPGRALASGEISPAQVRRLEKGVYVEAFGGCCAFRRALLDRHRFDDRLDGYAIDEDLDLSYRIGRETRLFVEPRAELIHHFSEENRYSPRRYTREFIVHRYWFLEKNIRHPLRKPAFWWSLLGRMLGAWLSDAPHAREKAKGYLDGARLVWRRSHPLL